MSTNPAAAGDGGGRAESMSTTLPMRHPILYRSTKESPASRKQEFHELVREMARKLAPFAITAREKDAIWDAQREVPRLSIAGLELLCELAARSDRPFVLEEAIRGAVIQRIAAFPTTSVRDLHIDETEAQGKSDVWQARFATETTPPVRDAVLDTAVPHLHRLRAYVDGVMRWSPTGRQCA